MDVKTIAIAVPLGLAVIFAALFIRKVATSEPTPARTQVVAWEPQSRNAGEVTIEVTPLELAAGRQPRFKVVFDTHSVDLAFQVEAITSLTDDQGGNFGEVAWTGSPPGGHHRSGELTFSQALSTKTKKLTLSFKDVAGTPITEVKWSLP